MLQPRSRLYSFRRGPFHDNPLLVERWMNWSGYDMDAARVIFGTGELMDKSTAAVVLGVNRIRIARYTERKKKQSDCKLNTTELFPQFKFKRNQRPEIVPSGKRKKYVIVDDLFISMLERRMMKPYDSYERHF